jgi:hypothetical protein
MDPQAYGAAPSAARQLFSMEAVELNTADQDKYFQSSSTCGMLHCLGMGGFDNAQFAHDVVMLNPDTHPYTHMFRYESFIQFNAPGAPRGSDDRFGNAFVYPCAESQRSELQRNSSSSLRERGMTLPKRPLPYSVIYRSERAPEYNAYVTEILSKL